MISEMVEKAPASIEEFTPAIWAAEIWDSYLADASEIVVAGCVRTRQNAEKQNWPLSIPLTFKSAFNYQTHRTEHV